MIIGFNKFLYILFCKTAVIVFSTVKLIHYSGMWTTSTANWE